MVQLSLSTGFPTPRAPGSAGFPALPGGFALTLAGVSALAPGDPGMPIDLPTAPGERQPDAAGGKSLPADAVRPIAGNDPWPSAVNTPVARTDDPNAADSAALSPLPTSVGLPRASAAATSSVDAPHSVARKSTRTRRSETADRRAPRIAEATPPMTEQASQILAPSLIVPPAVPVSQSSHTNPVFKSKGGGAPVLNADPPASRGRASGIGRVPRGSVAMSAAAMAGSAPHAAMPPSAQAPADSVVLPVKSDATAFASAPSSPATAIPARAGSAPVTSRPLERRVAISTGTRAVAAAEVSPAIGHTVAIRTVTPLPASAGVPALVAAKPSSRSERAGAFSDTIVVGPMPVPKGAETARPPLLNQPATEASSDGAGPRLVATTFGATAASRLSAGLTAVPTDAQAMPVIAAVPRAGDRFRDLSAPARVGGAAPAVVFGLPDMPRASAGGATDTVASDLLSASIAAMVDPVGATAPSAPREPGPAVVAGPVVAPATSGGAATAALTSAPAPADPTAASGRPDPVAPVTPPPLPATPRPAVIVFGAALATAFADRRAQAEAPASPDDPLLAGLMSAPVHATSAAATAMPGAAPLDMRRDDWPQAMLDRIEALRDAADANDTRIRLLPDALGKVDVSLHHDGDAVRVHFAAELPATQILLNNAQPRLAELAQARGLRISQNAVDAGGAGAGQHQRGTPSQPAPSTRPVSATTVADAGADSRLA